MEVMSNQEIELVSGGVSAYDVGNAVGYGVGKGVVMCAAVAGVVWVMLNAA